MGNSKKENDFFEKMKDKKYKAKVELLVYGLFIFIVLVGLNMAGASRGNSNTIIPINPVNNNDEDKDNLLNSINDNYEYNTIVSYNKMIDNNNKEYKEIYSGKSVTDNLIINKEINGSKSTFYKVGDDYYKDGENKGAFELLDDDDVYDLLPNKYLELSSIKKYLSIASLDTVNSNSDGARVEIYHLKVGDIIKSYKGEEVIDISAVMNDDSLVIKIDYSNLYKVLDVSVEKCLVDITYTNIGKVEKFDIINGE